MLLDQAKKKKVVLLLIRDFRGNVIVSASKRIHSNHALDLIEALIVEFGTKLAHDFRCYKIIVESDFRKVSNYFHFFFLAKNYFHFNSPDISFF